MATDPAAPVDIDLSVDLAGLRLRNPVMTASGTSGFGAEYARFADVKQLGAFVTKAVSPEPRVGNPPERTVETRGGMLNAIGLANVGLDEFVHEKLPFWEPHATPILVNVVGHTVEDYQAVCRRLDPIERIAGLELNVSCPNVVDGLEFGTDPARLEKFVRAVRPTVQRAKLIVKLSPNVTDIAACAAAAVAGGAEILSVINTLTGMAINVETRRPMLANRTGGLSGPAIKPVALFMVHKVYAKVAKDAQVPIIGMGGIMDWRDAAEFMVAGASAVALGTALFVHADAPQRICAGLVDYLRRHGHRRVSDIVGQMVT